MARQLAESFQVAEHLRYPGETFREYIVGECRVCGTETTILRVHTTPQVHNPGTSSEWWSTHTDSKCAWCYL